MLDDIKTEKKASLVFEFIESSERPKALQILNYKKEILEDIQELAFDLIDLSINEYKIYECILFYDSDKNTHSITIYYNRLNYFLCGKGSHSVEIIFCDFIFKEINSTNCYIEYNGKKYTPKENFELSTRKRINFVGINIQDLKLPKTINGAILDINPKYNKNLLINISVANEPKVIGMFTNSPFIDPKIKIENVILNELKNKIERASKPLNYKKENDFFHYIDGIDKSKLNDYENEILCSYEFEKKLGKYFTFYKEKLNDLEVELYDLYCEFMLLFPDFYGSERGNGKINFKEYINQYYYSKQTISNFYSTIPENLEKYHKIQLKYAACRCLKTLLMNGYGSSLLSLFYFIDYTIEGTIYYDANKFNSQFVDALNEKSEMFLFFLQINSGSGIDILTTKITARLSMLSENDIKSHLKSTIPKYGIRMNGNSFFKACTINEVRITCICESLVFQQYLGNNLKIEIDPFCNKRYILANLLQHEDFGHVKFSINFYSLYDNYIDRTTELDPVSPTHYYKAKTKEGMVEITKEENKNGKIKLVGESGLALSSFLTRGNKSLILLLQRIPVDFIGLFKKPTLLASEDLTEFIKELNSLNSDSKSEEKNNIRIKYEDFNRINGIPVGFPTIEKFA